MIELREDQFADLARAPAQAARMVTAVKLCHDRHYYVPAFLLASAAIDCLAGGKKAAYMKVLKDELPELSEVLAPKVFYEKFRNGIVHDFRPKPGYALANDHELGGAYSERIRLSDSKREYDALNIDRFLRDFIRVATRWGGG